MHLFCILCFNFLARFLHKRKTNGKNIAWRRPCKRQWRHCRRISGKHGGLEGTTITSAHLRVERTSCTPSLSFRRRSNLSELCMETSDDTSCIPYTMRTYAVQARMSIGAVERSFRPENALFRFGISRCRLLEKCSDPRKRRFSIAQHSC